MRSWNLKLWQIQRTKRHPMLAVCWKARPSPLSVWRWRAPPSHTRSVTSSSHLADTQHDTRSSTETSLVIPTHRSQELAQLKYYITPVTDIHDPKSWTDLLEVCLPASLRGYEAALGATADPSVAALIIENAQKFQQVDALTHLAVLEKRYDAAFWLAESIIRASHAPSKLWRTPPIQSSLEWPAQLSLDTLTAKYLSKSDIQDPASDLYRPKQKIHTSTRPSLEYILQPLVARKHNDLEVRERRRLGLIWMSLGRIVVATADASKQVQQQVATGVASVLKGFDAKDFLSTEAHQELPYAEESLVPTSSSQEVTLIFEDWLEQILWCCIHGGWLLEGANIITLDKHFGGNGNWGVRSSLAGASDTANKLNSGESPDRLKRFISGDVVTSLIDGLVTMTQGDRRATGYSMQEIVDRLHSLQGLLQRNGVSLEKTTWNSLVARMVDSRSLQHADSNPRLLESVLDLATANNSRPILRTTDGTFFDGVARSDETSLEDSTSIVGLFHRTLHAHVRARDVDGALRVLAALQRVTDQNKERRLQEFFRKLSDAQSEKDRQVWDDQISIAPKIGAGSAEHASFFPSIPVAILADLLDLLNDCNAVELGSWLIYSSDIDGPLIPESTLGNQVIAPALIRFAAATSDTALLRKLSVAQTSSISGMTLVALCESRMRQGQFKEANHVLGLIRDYSLHEWDASDLTRMLRALLLQIYGTGLTRDLRDSHSREASILCQRLLRGDLGQVWGEGFFRRIDTIVDVLSSADGHLEGLCSNLRYRSQNFTADLPGDAFGHLLDGIVQVWGSHKCMETWMEWCYDTGGRSTDSARSSRPVSIAEAFSTKAGEVDTTHLALARNDILPHSAGRVVPSIPLLRIIVREALKEHKRDVGRASSVNQVADPDAEAGSEIGSQKHQVLEWAKTVFQDDFGLSESEIDYELQGYLSSGQLGFVRTDSYSFNTIGIWQAFAGPRKEWARTTEESLRDLASRSGERLTFTDQPAAERALLVSFCEDFGLQAKTHGEGELQSVVITRPSKSEGKRMRVPSQRLDDVIGSSRDVE